MRILIISIGSRGDIEPFITIGEILSSKGHDIIFSFPEQFGKLIPEKYDFYPLSYRFLELLESKEGKNIMGRNSNPITKVLSLYKLSKEGIRVNNLMLNQQEEITEKVKPDKIVHHSKCLFPSYWSINNHKESILISLVPFFLYPFDNHAHLGINRDLGNVLNNLTYKLFKILYLNIIKSARKHLSNKYKTIAYSQLKNELETKKLVYTISPSILKRPSRWKSNVNLLGYHERDKTTEWEPDIQLVNFLNIHNKILFVTFGSMTNPTPAEKTTFICAILDEFKIPAIINTAQGGLVKISKYENNPNFLFISQIPYNWILEKVYAVIHHGGSGTTQLALKYGCPSLIIPHIVDQFSWNVLNYSLGTGPEGIQINKINKNNLKVKIADLINNKQYKSNAMKISVEMKNEDLINDLINIIEN
jgi:UDP:flavonoid glycosyltransferase YjiC (YdhE family)